uniref:F-box domain-containing protein n=1 Tax=Tanacetum cinerariifolium TaxID=118510 RepID=A0A6L2L5N7_TANCI|nr:hypothetical protein [Tanacetum cinerariifolium]
MKAQCLSMDRISSLHPTIKENILCLLPIHEAARTSVLSKEWRYIWTKIPKLVFDEDTLAVSTDEKQLSVMEQNYKTPSLRKDMNLMCKFFYAIYQILLAHQGPILEFILSVFSVDSCIEIDQILAYLSRQNTVMKLTLELQNEYKLPSSIFSLHQLTNLYLMFCKIDHVPRFSGFPSLTTLCLKNVSISKKSLRHLISNCPLLRNFSLFSEGMDIFDYGDNGATLIELLDCLHVVEHLTVSIWGLEDFFEGVRCSTRISNNITPPQILELQASEIDSVTLEGYSDIWLEHLNEFAYVDLGDSKLNLELVKLILAKSPLLKKVRITLCNKVTKDEELKICKVLLRSPRASPMVDIIVEAW